MQALSPFTRKRTHGSYPVHFQQITVTKGRLLRKTYVDGALPVNELVYLSLGRPLFRPVAALSEGHYVYVLRQDTDDRVVLFRRF